MKNQNYISRVKDSLLLQVVEKSFPSMTGNISIKKTGDSKTITLNTPYNNAVAFEAKFTDFNVEAKSPIDYPFNLDVLILRYQGVMAQSFEGYSEDLNNFLEQAAQRGE